MPTAGASWALALAAFACAKPAALPQPAATTDQQSTAAAGRPELAAPVPSASGARVRSGTPSPPQTPSPCSPDTASAALATAQFARLHAGPVLSAAVGTPPRAAIWSGRSVTIFEGEQARELPAPRLPQGATVEVFFGRDNQPRLLGFAPGEPGQEVPVYLRFRQGVFRPEPSELGPLAAPRGALYGVLGFADPEVVCRPLGLCLVKRVTGWGRVPAHDVPLRVVLRNGSVFAFHADRVDRLDDRGWWALAPAPTFEQPLDAWVAPNGELWVTDRSATGLFRRKGEQWEVLSSPIRKPRAVFGHSERAVFVVGENGAAEFDGTGFRCIRNLTGPLHLALAVGSDIWLAGESGLYRSGR